jgi:two-component system, NarL family, nitrate/nitrite response regulator NarL
MVVNGFATKVYIDTHSDAALDLRQSSLVQDQLTAARGDEASTGLNSQRSTGKNSIRVAIADPHAIFRDGLRKLLGAESDFEIVTEASSPVLLLSSLATTRPDILLISTPLEPEAGPDVFAVIQSQFPDIKVIVLSTAGDQDEFVRNVRSGARGIVQKSTSGSMLIKAIRKVQDGEFWLDRSTTAEVVRHFTERRAEPAAEPRQNEGRLPSLSRREREIVNLVTHGLRNKELAEKLQISEQTVKNHMHNIFDKLGVSDRLELALYAIHHNWHEAL